MVVTLGSSVKKMSWWPAGKNRKLPDHCCHHSLIQQSRIRPTTKRNSQFPTELKSKTQIPDPSSYFTVRPDSSCGTHTTSRAAPWRPLRQRLLHPEPSRWPLLQHRSSSTPERNWGRGGGGWIQRCSIWQSNRVSSSTGEHFHLYTYWG